MDVAELVTGSERKIERLRAQIAAEERFLKELRKRVPSPPTVREAALSIPMESVESPVDGGHRGAAIQAVAEANSGRRASRVEKRMIALAAMCERPGTWTTKDLDRVYREKDIDPEAGTPAKNILWHLAREGFADALGGGSYHLSRERAERIKEAEEL
jgi:hypothetical protein